MPYDENNIFAKILKKQSQFHLVFENDVVLCFKDKFPTAKTHVLVIPKRSCIDFEDFLDNAGDDEVVKFYRSVRHVAKNILGLKNYKINTNKGSGAGQVVFHFHIHIISNEESSVL